MKAGVSMETKTIKQKLSHRCYRVIRWCVQAVYPKIEVEGLENLPEEPCILVGNHSQMNGPIIGELYIPGDRAIWCAEEMMHLREVPAYAYRDFWSGKPRYIRWFFKLLSYLIAPLSVCIFNQAHTIAVYKYSRIVTTFRETVGKLTEGCNVVIFPEGPEKYNHIVNQFQDGFVDIARLYYRRTGKLLKFVPLYIAPKLKKAYLGKPIRFSPELSGKRERSRICEYLMQEISGIAFSLPQHTVIPYSNIPKSKYPTNIPCEVDEKHEKTSC